jgi:hypothetical protein
MHYALPLGIRVNFKGSLGATDRVRRTHSHNSFQTLILSNVNLKY